MTDFQLEQKTCPYCGGLVMCERGTDPRRRCRCADEVKYSADAETLEDMEQALEELFGENCQDESKVFLPVGENAMGVLHSVVVLAAAGLIRQANVTLSDGSVCIVNNLTVSRKVTVQK